MKKIKFAIIGCGRISYKHVEALLDNIDIAEPVAFCDKIEERAAARVDQYKEKEPEKEIKIYTDHTDMLEKEDFDVAVIATESGYHGQIAKEVLQKGRHVMIEKPIALDLDEIDEIIKLSREKNLKVCVCHQNRYNPPIQKLRKAIEDKRFGKIVNITARILWNRNDGYYSQAPWRGTRALDGGTLMNQCIHNIDLLQWMMGSEPIRIKAELDTFLRPIEMEDYGSILVRFKNNSIGVIEGSACVYPKNLEETLSVFGEKGTVVIGGLANNELKVWQFEDERDYDKEQTDTEIDNVYGHGHTPLYRDFIEAINQDKDPLITAEEAKKSVQIILGAYEESGI